MQTSCTYSISFDPLDNPGGSQGSSYDPFTDEEFKAQKGWDTFKGTHLVSEE